MKLDSSKLTKFLDSLPIPPLLDLKKTISNHHTLTMSEFSQNLHSQLPPTTVWGFNGSYPGPTIEVFKDNPVKIKWDSDLPRKHLFNIDKTLYDTGNTPNVRNVIHLHGGVNRSKYDGYPLSWFSPTFKEVGPTFEDDIYTYYNLQNACNLWYHDHCMGITRLNNYAGLSGMYLIRDYHELNLNLPKGKYELPLVIQDRCFNEDGSLHYPKNESAPCASKSMGMDMDMDMKDNNSYLPMPDISVVPEFFGDTFLVNGKVWPYFEVEPRKYRFRILNGCNSRFLNLYLSNKKGFYQIGTDVGFLNNPIKLNFLLLSPAERADLIIDFSKFKEKEILLQNNANAPFPNGSKVDSNTKFIMKFKILDNISDCKNNKIPNNLNNIPSPASLSFDKIRKITLDHTEDKYGRETMLLNNKVWLNPISINPKLNDTEIWEIYNFTPKAHPIHIHLVHFQILNIQDFIKDKGNIEFTSTPYLPPINEQGYKDTVKVMPNTVVRLIMKFTNFTGKFVFHCHMLEHEDHEMMRPFRVRK